MELKSSCAKVMASKAVIKRSLDSTNTQTEEWDARAKLAVKKGRDDLAREALLEKQALQTKVDALNIEVDEHERLVEQYRDDIEQLNAKLDYARQKYRSLVQRHTQAKKSQQAREQLNKFNSAEKMLRFDKLEQQVDRIEAEADLAKPSDPSLDEKFHELELSDSIEQELKSLKEASKGVNG